MKQTIFYHVEQYNETGALGHLIVAGRLAEAEYTRGAEFSYVMYVNICTFFQIFPIPASIWLFNKGLN